MNVDTIVSDVKVRVEPIVTKGQDVAVVTFETLKQANEIVVVGVQELVKTNVDAGKGLFAAAQTSFEKAKSDGVKAVATKPVEYLPSTEVVFAAYTDSVAVVTKTGEQLVKVAKKGYEDIYAAFNGTTTVSAEVKKAKSTVKKTVKKASAAAKKAAE